MEPTIWTIMANGSTRAHTVMFGFAPAEAQIKLALLGTLAAAHDEQVTGPVQFSQQCCENWLPPVSFKKLTHPPDVRGGETLDARLPPLDVGGQFFNRALAPGGLGNLPADVRTNFPVEVDQLDVHRLEGAVPGGLDQVEDFIEGRGLGNSLASGERIGFCRLARGNSLNRVESFFPG